MRRPCIASGSNAAATASTTGDARPRTSTATSRNIGQQGTSWYFSPACRAAAMWPTWTPLHCCRAMWNSSNSAVVSSRCSANFIAPASDGTEPIRCVRSFDLNLEEHGYVCREDRKQRRVEILAAIDADAFDSVTRGQRAEIEMRQPHPGQQLDVKVTAELFERAIARVVDDDEGDGKSELGGAPQSLNGVHGRAIAEQSDHLASRPRQRDTDRRGQAMAEPAARARMKRLALQYGQVIMHRCAAARRLLDDDGVSGAQRSDLLHQISIGQRARCD